MRMAFGSYCFSSPGSLKFNQDGTFTHILPGVTSDEFATRLIHEEELAVVPGTAFGDCGEGFLRISYAYSIDQLREAMIRMERFITKLRNS